MSVLEVRGLTKAYDQPVLRGVDLDVASGTVVAVLGPSGCGKTTLLRILAGFERADAGSVALDGRPIDYFPPERRRMAVVPQEG